MTSATLKPYREHVSLAERQSRQPEVAEDVAPIVVALFEAIRRECDNVQNRIARGELQYDPNISRSFSELLQKLAQAFELVRGHLPPNRLPPQFLEYLNTMRRINQFDVDSVAGAIEDVRRGKTISLAEGMDALRDSAAH